MSVLTQLNTITYIFVAAGGFFGVVAIAIYYGMGLKAYRRNRKTSKLIRGNANFNDPVPTIPKKGTKNIKTLTEEDMQVGIGETTKLDLVGTEETAKLNTEGAPDAPGEEFAEALKQGMMERSARSFPEDSLVWGIPSTEIREITPKTAIKELTPRVITPSPQKNVKKNMVGREQKPVISVKTGALIATGTLVLIALHHQLNKPQSKRKERSA